MFRPVALSCTVPVFVPDAERIVDFWEGWANLWIAAWTPVTHEVIDWPIRLQELPDRPDVDLNDLPNGVVRFGD